MFGDSKIDAIIILSGFVGLMILTILYFFDQTRKIQKFYWFRSGWLILESSVILFLSWFIYFFVNQIEMGNHLTFYLGIVLICVVLIAIGVFGLSVYVETLLILAAKGKSIERIKKGEFEYNNGINKYLLNQETIEKIEEYVTPFSGETLFIFSVVFIHLKTGVVLNINSILCDSSFFISELKDIPYERKKWKPKKAISLIHKNMGSVAPYGKKS